MSKVTAEMLKGVTVLDDIEKYLPNNVSKKYITKVTIPNSVTEIGNNAFNGCYRLKTLVIPKTVTKIGGSAFYFCYSLKSIDIPNSVTKIEGGAFGRCDSLESVNIPNSVTEIGGSAFKFCESLEMFIVSKDFNKTNKEVYEMLKTEYPSVKIVYKK